MTQLTPSSPSGRWWEQLHADEPPEVYDSMRRRLPAEGKVALILIDVVRAFVGEPGRSLTEAVRAWPTACGPAAHEALPAISDLLAAARAAEILIVHCRPGAEFAPFTGDTVKGERGPGWVAGRPGAVDFDPSAMPEPDELVLAKPKASAFFDTHLTTTLHEHNIRRLVVAGGSTSGCVRATVVDAFSYGFAPFVVEDAVFDRSRTSAAASLWDMDSRYADVIELAPALDIIADLPRGSSDGAAATGATL